MKIRYFPVLALILIQACASVSPTPLSPGSESQSESVSQPIVMTVLPAESSGVGAVSVTSTPDPHAIFTGDVTIANQGQTINLQVGDSFLLKLGDEQFTWAVNVDNQSVLNMQMGVMVIKGAQGIYEALAPGTATLTAVGDPVCRQTTPPCASPSILFTLQVVVK